LLLFIVHHKEMYNHMPLKIYVLLTHTGSLQPQISLLCELNNNEFLG